MWPILKTLQRALSRADPRTDGANIHTQGRKTKRDRDRYQDSNRLINRGRCVRVCVCLCLSTTSTLTAIGGSRLHRPAQQSHSKPSVNQTADVGPKTMIASEITVFTRQPYTHTHKEVKVTALPRLNMQSNTSVSAASCCAVSLSLV